MEVIFDKLHGLGNDYIYIDLDRYPLPDISAFAREFSNRRTGIGGDGVITYNKEASGHYLMRIFNLDGSEGLMCGNAIRCVGKLLYEKGLCRENRMTINTKSGTKILQLNIEQETVVSAQVDMGQPTIIASDREVMQVRGTQVSVGNPHFVHFIDEDLYSYPLQTIGPQIEHNEAFPEGINYEIARVLNRHTIEMRVWERGSGLTQACGTGATATAVAAIACGLADSPVSVQMPGGELTIDWGGTPEQSAFMTGPATYVYQGKVKI